MPLKPSYLVLAGAGGLVAVAGIKGWSLSKSAQDLISGHNPSVNAKLTSQITGASFYGYGAGPSGIPGGASGGIAGIAESLIGTPYAWGGAPATGRTDCSGLVNWAVGHLAGLSIPGYANGSYTGTTHGPNTLMWLAWGAAGRMAKLPLAQTQGGDLAIWQSHMGIIVDNGKNMVSDLNPSLGTRKTGIVAGGPGGELLTCWRLKVRDINKRPA